MILNYLFDFSIVAKTGSFSLAAEELCLSQSSLSKHIMNLEKQLGVQLFERTTRRVILSRAGEQILPYANQITELEKKIINIAFAQNQAKNCSLAILSIPVMAQYDITGAIAQFQKDFPDINLSILELEPYEIIGLLQAEKYELAFIRRYHDEGLDYITFFEDHLVAALPHSHHLSHENELKLEQLIDEEFLFLNKETLLYDFCFQLCLNAGFTPAVKYTSHRPENIIDLVSQGMGIGLIMKGHTSYFKNRGVVYVDIAPSVFSTVCLVKMKDSKLSLTAELFLEYIKTNFSV